MSHLITALGTLETTAPAAVHDYSAARQSRNIIHDTLDSGIGVSFVTPRPRTGTLNLVYDDAALARIAHTLLGTNQKFRWQCTDVSFVEMLFVLDGQLDIKLDAAVGIWHVTTGFMEVSG